MGGRSYESRGVGSLQKWEKTKKWILQESLWKEPALPTLALSNGFWTSGLQN